MQRIFVRRHVIQDLYRRRVGELLAPLAGMELVTLQRPVTVVLWIAGCVAATAFVKMAEAEDLLMVKHAPIALQIAERVRIFMGLGGLGHPTRIKDLVVVVG